MRQALGIDLSHDGRQDHRVAFQPFWKWDGGNRWNDVLLPFRAQNDVNSHRLSGDEMIRTREALESRKHVRGGTTWNVLPGVASVWGESVDRAGCDHCHSALVRRELH